MIDPALAVTFDFDLFIDRLGNGESVFWEALFTTVYISVISEVLGIALGLATFAMQRSRLLPVRVVAYAYALVFRGTPIIVQIFFVFFGANLLLGFDLFPQSVEFLGLGVSGAVLAGITALALNEGAYMSEIVRAGIDSVDKGQMEAALSTGMTRRLAMRRIILPQAARVIVPPLGNQFNYMLKTTALLAFIGVYELFRDAQVVYSRNFQPVEVFAGVAVWYFVLTTGWTLMQVQIERKLGASERDEGEGWITKILGIQARSRA